MSGIISTRTRIYHRNSQKSVSRGIEPFSYKTQGCIGRASCYSTTSRPLISTILKLLSVSAIRHQIVGCATVPKILSSTLSADKSAQRQGRGGSCSSLIALKDLLLGLHVVLGLCSVGKANTRLCNGYSRGLCDCAGGDLL